MDYNEIDLLVRYPAVAGAFYPDAPDKLSEDVEGYLQKAQVEPITGRLCGLIVPHAGYVYSGWIAAYGYKLLQGLSFDTVILVGLCHRGLKYVSIYDRGVFRTPLGPVEIDRDLALEIIKQDPSRFEFDPASHFEEHSLEVQLPFLQKTLKNFKIVPILVDESYLAKPLGEAIVKSIHGSHKKVLVIGSTDLTHYPSYENAKKVDQDAVEAILSLEPEKIDDMNKHWLGKGIPNLHCTICSEAAVKTVMRIAKSLGADTAVLLKAANSGDVSIGYKDEVVGYAAIALVQEAS